MKVRYLYGSLVGDSGVKDQVMSMAFKEINILVLCHPKSNQLSEFDKIGMSFLTEELLDPRRHTG